MKFKYFIWDIGGTLFDTTATSVKAFAQTLSEFGQTPDEQKIFELLKEKSTPVAARYFMGDKQDEFLKRYHEIETPMQENPVMFSDTKETLKQVVASGGKNYIISHRDLQVVDFLESCDLIGYFSYVITSNDHFARKPSPESLQYLFDRFGVQKETAIMIGDRQLDIMAAKNAGIKGCLYSPDGFIQVPEADFTVKKLIEVLSLEVK